jgi:hypothetical protein
MPDKPEFKPCGIIINSHYWYYPIPDYKTVRVCEKCGECQYKPWNWHTIYFDDLIKEIDKINAEIKKLNESRFNALQWIDKKGDK